MNNKEQELYDKLLKEKQDIENGFKFNSNYNRTEKHNSAIVYDPIRLMDMSNDRARKHNEKVRAQMPSEYTALMVSYVFVYKY